jgi:hypothetical protein
MRGTQRARRRALIAANGAHVADWRTWRWRCWCEASADRARERMRRSKGRDEEWREALAELRASLAPAIRPRPDFSDLWVE